MSDRSIRLSGLYALVAAVVAVLLAPLLALSYVGTGAGRDELETASVAAWAEPGRELAGGLLTWASPDRVYTTYWQVFALLVPAMFVCARAARARRSPSGGLERWGWRLALTGYALEKAGFLALFCALLVVDLEATVVDVAFLGVAAPGLLISAIGSTVLGVALLRARYRPRVTSWLLALAVPSLVVLPAVLGNLALGLLPLFLAWAVAGLRLRHAAAGYDGYAELNGPRRESAARPQGSASVGR